MRFFFVDTNSRQVNAHDEDDHTSSEEPKPLAAPNSPPPSFRSRASSVTRQQQVDPDLADAFDSDNDSDYDSDDRQRLVRQAATPSSSSNGTNSGSPVQQPVQPSGPANVSAATRGRAVGGGVGTDGVFANMSARPERPNEASEKDEQPPVSIHVCPHYSCGQLTRLRHTNKLLRIQRRRTGRRQFWPLEWVASTKYMLMECRLARCSHLFGTA